MLFPRLTISRLKATALRVSYQQYTDALLKSDILDPADFAIPPIPS
jgi:hypothetical protein